MAAEIPAAPAALIAQPFPRLMGVEIVEAGKDRVRGRLTVRPDVCTAGHILHGGAIMAFADTLGATGAFLNLPEGAGGTTTIESKTNFIGAAREGTTVDAEALPIHIGRRRSVWQTRITRADGKLVAIVTQTQMVL
ncbi:MAG: PaaI family thioesterase [Alphaproteobacteria bacterium]|nr:PaaI family thioesterase [Alphaproteobacteria bacterium]